MRSWNSIRSESGKSLAGISSGKTRPAQPKRHSGFRVWRKEVDDGTLPFIGRLASRAFGKKPGGRIFWRGRRTQAA
ncbi:MAG: hypothetical protein DCC68_19790 [Planctomycetota bacterium]|nr:MAG: hypothetical protein DCC68_19790 [Planctomycetota bacterium]